MEKSKTFAVWVFGKCYLVQAMTRSGALRDLMGHIKSEVYVDLATGEQIYTAGVNGEAIIGSERYKNKTDPCQIPLAGVPETAASDDPGFVV